MQFRVLGPVEVDGPAGPIRIEGAKLRALLVLLLIRANEVVSSDRLADGLWGEEPPAGGSHALEVYISRLRAILAGGRIETHPPGYRIRVEHDELDLDRFERLVREASRASDLGDHAGAVDRLEQAIALWRGPPLPELRSGPYPRPEVIRLEEMRIAAIEADIEARLALGRAAEVVSELEALVAEHPFRESLRAQLMRALYRVGRQADALQAFQAARQELNDELGIEPGPLLQRLQLAILNQESELGPLGLHPLTQAAIDARPAARGVPVRTVLVIGRSVERFDSAIALAGILGHDRDAEAIVAGLASDGADLAETMGRVRRGRETLQSGGLTARGVGFISAAPGPDALRLAGREDVALLLLPGSGIDVTGRFDPFLCDVLGGSPADVAIVVDRGRPVRLAEGSALGLPFGGTDDDWAALELSVRLASMSGARLILLGVPTPDRDEASSTRLIADASLLVQRVTDVMAEPRIAAPGRAGLIDSIADLDLVVAGLSGRWRDEGLGPARTAFVQDAPGTLVFVRRGLRPGLLAPREGMSAFTWSLAAMS